MLDAILAATEQSTAPDERAEVYLCIAKQFNLLNQPQKTLEFIESALLETRLLSSEYDYFVGWLYCEIAPEFAKANQREHGLGIINQALVKARRNDDIDERDKYDIDERDHLLIRVAEAFAESEFYDQAIQAGLQVCRLKIRLIK